MLKRLLTTSLCFCLLILSSTLHAQEKIAWTDLSYEERLVLQQLESQWDELSAERQLRLQRGANRWQQMRPVERSEAQVQQQRFRELAPQQRQLINQRFQRFNSLNRTEQIRLRNIQRRYQSLSEEQRQVLREQFEQRSQQIQRNSDASSADTTNINSSNTDAIQNRENQRRVQEVIRQNQNVLRPNNRPNVIRQQVRPNTADRPRVTTPR